MPYVTGQANPDQWKTDSGRVRDDNFFKKMYGDTEYKVKSNVTTVLLDAKGFPTKIPFAGYDH